MYHPLIREVRYDGGAIYSENRLCAVDFEASSDNKGFEGLQVVAVDGEKYFVGLCEGNYCSHGRKGRESGNGRLVLIGFGPHSISEAKHQYLVDVGIGCLYSTMDTVALPPAVDFVDYSALQFRPCNDSGDGFNYEVVVVSQESAALWRGKAEWTQQNGLRFGGGAIYQFPKGGDCQTQFCNVEGVQMLDDDSFVMVSDEVKGRGKQPWICGQKDQSIHIFKIRP